MDVKQNKNNVCFSIGPFNPEGHRMNMKILIDAFCKKVGLEHKPFWDQTSPVMDERIFNELVTANLVIADLTGLNPNVMYEVGVRHSFNGKIIHLIPSSDPRPWDIDKNYILSFEPPIELHHFDKLIDSLTKLFDAIDKIDDSKPRNALINHVKRNAKEGEVFKTLKEDPNTDKALVGLIQELSNDVKELKKQQTHYPNIISQPIFWGGEADIVSPIKLSDLRLEEEYDRLIPHIKKLGDKKKDKKDD